MKQTIINIIALAVALFGGYLLVTDGAKTLFGINQYLFNAGYLFIVLPACLGMSDIVRKNCPESNK